MSLPNNDAYFKPIMEYFKNSGKDKYINNDKLKLYVIEKLSINKNDEKENTPGGQNRLKSFIAWTITYLCHAGLFERPERGFVQITEEGIRVIENEADNISVKYLKDNYPDFREFATPQKDNKENRDIIDEKEEEITNDLFVNLDSYYTEIEDLILERLLKKAESITTVKQGDMLENLSVDLLSKMGYYDVKKTGGPHDGGIDGDFAIDKFGLERIAFQCKFFQKATTISSKDIDAFVGSLQNFGYSKGVFITTARFSSNCNRKNITLIDGIKLAELMRKYQIGCKIVHTYYQYEIDSL